MSNILKKARADNPQWKDLSDHDLATGLYNTYFSDKLTPEQFNKEIGYTPKAGVMDYVKKLASGSGAILDAGGYVAGKAGADDLKQSLYDAGQSTRDYWDNSMSNEGKYVANNRVFKQGEDGSIGLGETPFQSGLMGIGSFRNEARCSSIYLLKLQTSYSAY